MANEAYEKLWDEFVKLGQSWAEASLKATFPELVSDLGKVTFSDGNAVCNASDLPLRFGWNSPGTACDKAEIDAAGEPRLTVWRPACFTAAGLTPVDFELPDTTDMVTIESDDDGPDEPFDPDPPFEIELVVRDIVDGQKVVLSLAPKPDMRALEAFWLSVFERHYDNYGDDAASGSVVEWLRKHDLLRHFETA